MLVPRWSFALLLVAGLGCDASPVAPGLQALQGRWLFGPEALQPTGHWTQEFVVHRDGRTENRITFRGLYAAQGPADLSASQVLYGRINVVGDRFVVHPDSEVTEDRFYGPRHRLVRTRDIRWWVTDSVTFEVRNDSLTVHFFTYPADAPVLTTGVYRRAG